MPDTSKVNAPKAEVIAGWDTLPLASMATTVPEMGEPIAAVPESVLAWLEEEDDDVTAPELEVLLVAVDELTPAALEFTLELVEFWLEVLAVIEVDTDEDETTII